MHLSPLLLNIPRRHFLLAGLIATLALATARVLPQTQPQVLGETTEAHTYDYSIQTPHIPKTLFTSTVEEVTETETIPYETVIAYDTTKTFDFREITQEGVNGSLTFTYLVNYYYGEETERSLQKTTEVAPLNELVTHGTLPLTIDTPEGPFSYTATLDVWATSYDGNCKGCSGITYTGTPVEHGICAVDPNSIPLYSTFYVPGYGICQARDIGGAIKGNKIDVGFENVAQGWWSARWVEIYLE